MKIKLAGSCLCAALLLVAVVAPDSAGAIESGRRGARARAYLVLRISESLGLSDEKALEISSILRRSGDARRALREERQGMLEPLQAAVDAGDEAKLNDLVARANEIDRKLSLMPSQSFLQIQEVLSPVERGKLILLLPELQNDLRNRRRGRRGGEPPADK